MKQAHRMTDQSSQRADWLESGRRFILGRTPSHRLGEDFFNFYGWLAPQARGRVLDAGCGSGLSTFLLAHRATEVWGIDVSEAAIAFATDWYLRPHLRFSVGDLRTVALPDSYFDVIVLTFVIEQLDREAQAPLLQRLQSALAVGGTLIIATPNRLVTSPRRRRSGNAWNVKELSRQELTALLCSVGFTRQEWYGQRMVFRPLVWYPIRGLIRLLERTVGRPFGFYGRRESPRVKPCQWYWQPKEFIMVTKK
ncbi:MAG: hypothetical protein A3J59_02395 [Candidatus Buchananbacteria bacterium RIFCSPHIGHO2_02_FULL_56_16]|uniref:Methyltransferase domain-containing protein n=1 Tax=Candidatus Buchananbacteria bacterium RIFCSPHIGHO2_02_FULL_56_16 TaxID=1797542 RepID=A0A1G1YIJ5_9BACT|nr:MAG: hypothetical protein A3J59_02395 [Candidatus Buchananbacteria bacterium RIFCSPHIGHO2_02_FULL_56_16]